MEGTNNTNTLDSQVGEIMAQIKQEVIEGVTADLKAKGITILPHNYDPGKEIANKVREYDAKKAEYEEEKVRIMERYSNNVASNLLGELAINFNLDTQELLEDLKKIEEKDLFYKQKEYEVYRNNDKYDKIKNEAIDLFSKLQGLDVPADMVMDIAGEIIKAGDVKTLSILKLFTKDKTMGHYVLDGAIRSINENITTSQHSHFIQEATQYINSGGKKDSLTLFSYLSRYQ